MSLFFSCCGWMEAVLAIMQSVWGWWCDRDLRIIAYITFLIVAETLAVLSQCKNPAGTFLNVSWKSPRNLLGWICRQPVIQKTGSFDCDIWWLLQSVKSGVTRWICSVGRSTSGTPRRRPTNRWHTTTWICPHKTTKRFSSASVTSASRNTNVHACSFCANMRQPILWADSVLILG